MYMQSKMSAKLLFLLVLGLGFCQRSLAIAWTEVFRAELSSRTFSGFRLCSAPANTSVIVNATDGFYVQLLGEPGRFETITSRVSENVIFCGYESVDGTYTFLLASMQSAIQWTDICDNTLNLTVSLQSSVSLALQQSLRPCNYDVQHAGLTGEQVTAWILLTYTADWGPRWLNRTLNELGDGNATAFVMLSSSADALFNVTWSRVQATSEQLATSMKPGQQVQAILASISIANGQNWWPRICSVINATENLLVTISRGLGPTIKLYMNCASLTQPTLVWGSPSNSSTNSSVAPSIESSSGGYWRAALQRLLTEQTFGGLSFCNASNGVDAIRVTTVDDAVIERDSTIPPTLVRSAVDFYVTPCDNGTGSALGDAFLKVFLQRDANWTDVCADSSNPAVTVNFQNRTAYRFSPCPASPNVTAAVAAAKLAWCILALNSSGFELEWVNRDISGLVLPSAASVAFSIFGSAGGSALRWGNVFVNGLSTGSSLDRLEQVFRSVNTAYWPVVCQLLNSPLDNFMSIEIRNSSRTVSFYANCSYESPLSSTPPPSATTLATSTLRPTTSTTAAPTTASTTAAPTTASTTAAPTTASTAAAPTTASTTAAPTTASTTAAPSTASTTAAPTTASTTAAPTTASTTAAPSTASTTAAPSTASTTAAPSTASTTAAPTTKSTMPPPTTSPTSTHATPTVADVTTTAGPAPGTPDEQLVKNRQEVKDAQENLQLGTQIAVVVFALATLLVLSTFGICKLVAPRTV